MSSIRIKSISFNSDTIFSLSLCSWDNIKYLEVIYPTPRTATFSFFTRNDWYPKGHYMKSVARSQDYEVGVRSNLLLNVYFLICLFLYARRLHRPFRQFIGRAKPTSKKPYCLGERPIQRQNLPIYLSEAAWLRWTAPGCCTFIHIRSILGKTPICQLMSWWSIITFTTRCRFWISLTAGMSFLDFEFRF